MLTVVNGEKNVTKDEESCSAVQKETEREDQCNIASGKKCENQYVGAYYCLGKGFPRIGIILIYTVWLVLLFQLLGTTADEYFSPALEQLSTDFGLPPRFAGVTLLALGNGAPDVSSTIHAVASSSHGYRLALGSLTGAGMFVGTVVAGAVIYVGNGAKAKGALLRDVSAYMLACLLIVFVFGSVGRVSYAGITLFLFAYCGFVILVLVADLWHRRPGGPAEQIRRAARANDENNDDDDDEPPAIELLLTLLHTVRRPNYPHESLDDTDYNPLGGGEVESPHFEDPSSEDIPPYVVIDGDGPAPLELGDSLNTDRPFLTEDTSISETPPLCTECLQRCLAHVQKVNTLILYQRIPAIIELPFVFFRRLTVPLTCDDVYARGPLCISCLGAPIWLWFYGTRRGAATGIHGLLICLILGSILALVLALYTNNGRTLPGAASLALSLFGFAIAATWIDVLADELVSLLEFFGILANIPDTALGLTVLAWGNSIGDFSTNIAMAKKNMANMAITASFAGPLFNALVGLGLGFAARLASIDDPSVPVSLNPALYASFAFLVFNCLSMLIVGIACNGVIPRMFGIASVVFYFAYLLTSLTLLL